MWLMLRIIQVFLLLNFLGWHGWWRVDLVEHVNEGVFKVALFLVEFDNLEAVFDHAGEHSGRGLG